MPKYTKPISNSNYVCVPCRASRRADEWSAAIVCPNCRQAMTCLGKNWRVPKRTDDQGWGEVARHVAKIRRVAHKYRWRP